MLFILLALCFVIGTLANAKRGAAGAKAFQDSWNDNKSLILAASFAGKRQILQNLLTQRSLASNFWIYTSHLLRYSLKH